MQLNTLNSAPQRMQSLYLTSIPKEQSVTAKTYVHAETAYCITIESKAELVLEEVRVGMAEMKVENRPVELVTSVGSCVAVCMYDPVSKCGGLTHVMLPDSSIAPQNLIPGKFADKAVPALAQAISEIGGNKTRLSAKIAGGANMFPTVIKSNGSTIGEKNINAIKAALAAHGIKLIAGDVGGSHGRKIIFNVSTGVMRVKKFNGEVKTL
ncbi:MAG: chemotaxis protein CheD [Candidatus Bathyarchaeia archaeon]